jgi:membrane associated rhomboid family serine protease
MGYRRYSGLNISPIWIIVIVNVLVFIASVIDQSAIFLRFGLIPREFVSTPWTVFTYMFVHANWSHIFFNMLTLYFFGSFALSLVGEASFLVTYFVGGVVGGLFYYGLATLLGNSSSILVGASGAIYALGGLLLVMRPNARVVTFPIPVPMPLWIAILVGFLIVAFLPGVAWEAHLGGIVYGAVVGLYFRRREIRRY